MEDPCSYSQLLDFIIDHQSSPDQLTSLDSEMPAVWKAMPITQQSNDQIGSMNNGINNQDSIGEFLCIIFACLIRNYLLFSGIQHRPGRMGFGEEMNSFIKQI